MITFTTTRALACLTALAASISLPAQALGSKNFFMPAVEIANGGKIASANFRNTVAMGAGIVPPGMSSPSFRIAGGYAATLDVAIGGQPWITSVAPTQITPNGGTILTIQGINLDVGSIPTIQVGTMPTQLVSRSPDRIRVRQLSTKPPGHPPVTMANSRGLTTLSDRLRVLPLLECDPAPVPDAQFDFVFRGTQGDRIVWAISVLRSPQINVPPLFHGLLINPGAMVIMPGLAITSPDGVLRFPVGPTRYLRPVHVQAVFRSANAGYAPGSFSNVIDL